MRKLHYTLFTFFIALLFAGNVYSQWLPTNGPLPGKDVRSIAMIGTNLFAGINGGGVWMRPLSDMISSVDYLRKPFETPLLEQNQPNPFNETTRISFRILSKSFVSLKVFDAFGREEAVILSQELSPGTYSHPWSAFGLPDGVYFYRLQVGTLSETKKLLLVK